MKDRIGVPLGTIIYVRRKKSGAPEKSYRERLARRQAVADAKRRRKRKKQNDRFESAFSTGQITARRREARHLWLKRKGSVVFGPFLPRTPAAPKFTVERRKLSGPKRRGR
jgi:hypothetical protein